MPMSGLYYALIPLLALAWLYPEVGVAAAARKSIGAWDTVCSTGKNNYCTASARVEAVKAGLPYRFQLNVSRAAPTAEFEIALLTAREHPGPDSTIVVQVDQAEAISLPPGQGYRKAGRTNTYLIAEQWISPLLIQMRKGQRIRFTFQDAEGQPVTAVFSLSGVSGALAFADKLQPRPKAAARSPAEEPVAERKSSATAQTRADATAPARPAPKPATKPTFASRKRGANSIREFSCWGNEPFWTFVVANDKARYASMAESGDQDPIPLAGKLNVGGDGPTPITDWRGKSNSGASYRAVITEERCQDTMSDAEGQTQFAYRVALTLPDGKTARGCCNEGLEPVKPAETSDLGSKVLDTTQYPIADLRSKPESDWTHHLADLLPAIEACIDETPDPDPFATKAWSMNRGMVGVRTRNREGGWFECIAQAQGLEVEHFGQLPPGTRRAPNEDHAVFSLPDGPPPEGNCYHHERVMDGMGDFRGWLSTNEC